MAEPYNDLPRYFGTLAQLRFWVAYLCIGTAVYAGKVATRMHEERVQGILQYGGMTSDKQMLHRDALILESIIASWAALWGLVYIGFHYLAGSFALRWSMRSDIVVALVSVASIVMQHVSRRDISCKRVSNAEDWTASEEVDLCFDLTATSRLAIVLLSITIFMLYFSIRWLLINRVSEPRRVVSDDWPKNRSSWARPYLKLLQHLAAPFRFFWRCCCKLGNSSKNPTMWAFIWAFLALPVLFLMMLVCLKETAILVYRGLKTVVEYLYAKTEGFRKRREARTNQKIQRKLDGISEFSIETQEMSDTQSEPSKAGKCDIIVHVANRTVEDTGYERRPRFTALLRRSRPVPIDPGSKLLDRTLSHPVLFFELLSHLHGADVRALSTVSKQTHKILHHHRTRYPHATSQLICSRPDPSPEHPKDTMNSAHEILAFHPNPTSVSIDAPIAEIYAAVAASAASSTNPSELQSETAKIVIRRFQTKPYPCWSCGITACGCCQKEREKLRVSKAEVRLHSLEPVCNKCYFKCLCHPTYVKDTYKGRRWPGLGPPPKVFRSISKKCTCTTQRPPKLAHGVCRDCKSLSMLEMWRLRLRRGAVASFEELPVSVRFIRDVYAHGVDDNGDGSVSSDSEEEDEEGDAAANGGDVDVEAIAGLEAAHVHDGDGASLQAHYSMADTHNGETTTTSMRRGRSLPPTPDHFRPPRPTLATNKKYCYACHERLWILPTWLGGGTTRGFRWWRCRRCGLEARDVMMSARREFL